MPTSAPTTTTAESRALLARLDQALAAVEELPLQDHERFHETHALFEERSDQREQITAALCARAAEREWSRSGRAVRVLGVGCGAGEVDLELARTLAASGREVQYVGLDPSPAMCDAAARRFERAALPGVRFEVAASGFEEHESRRPFDLIHFVHSLYYVRDAAAAMARARGMLAEGGELIAVQAPREELNELATLFYDRVYGRPTLFAEDLERICASEGWAHEQRRIDAHVDMTALVAGDPRLGPALRDFVVQVDARRLPAEIVDLVERYLCGVAVERDGRSLVAHPVDAFFIAG